jgi:hypothetical protein
MVPGLRLVSVAPSTVNSLWGNDVLHHRILRWSAALRVLFVTIITVVVLAASGTVVYAAPAYVPLSSGWHQCPAGYACLWEHSYYQGRGVGFFGVMLDFSRLPERYRFIQDTASSVRNNGTSGKYAVLAVNCCGQGGGVLWVLSPARGCAGFTGYEDLEGMGFNDTISSVEWESGPCW